MDNLNKRQSIESKGENLKYDSEKMEINLHALGSLDISVLLTVLDQVEELIVLLDNNRRIIYANGSLRHELGVACDEIFQKPLHYFAVSRQNKLKLENSGQIRLFTSGGESKKYTYNAQEIGNYSQYKLIFLSHSEELDEISDVKSSRFTKELENAKRIHQANLPHIPPSEQTYATDAFYRPAEHLGGDFYDIFKVDHGAMNVFFDHVVLTMIDVTGHGLDAAMMSGFLKNTIKSYFMYSHRAGVPVDPSNIMSEVYHEYCKADYPEELFACVLIGVCDFTTNKFLYSSSGFQFPGKVIRSSGERTKFDLGGLPLSSAIHKEMYDFSNYEIAFQPGDYLFLSTDGLLEQENDKGDSYYQRIDHLLTEVARKPQDMLSEIIHDFDQWLGEKNQDDDITCLFVKYK